jgi:hypothetical protein
MEEAVCCTKCQSVGLARYVKSGSLRKGLFLLCLFVIPGVVYFAWHLCAGHWGCSTCGSRLVVPMEDPDMLLEKGLYPREFAV